LCDFLFIVPHNVAEFLHVLFFILNV